MNLNRSSIVFFVPLLLLSHASTIAVSQDQQRSRFDVVIYGGTSAGLVAGIQALEMGKSVVVLEPTGRIGGLATGGLGQTDIGNKQVIGGLARRFYEKVAEHYAAADAWKWQPKGSYRSTGQSKTTHGETAMWTFEPSVALDIYRDWIKETNLAVKLYQRLNRKSGVVSNGRKILSIKMESGEIYQGKVFIDATYEGDLMAAAGVTYTIGREANETYGETLNGVQTKRNVHHNFAAGVDPYRIQGDKMSGLLPFIDPTGPGLEGAADHRVQAYCYRMCLTDHPGNRIPFEKPTDYDPEWYELLLRNFEAGEKRIPWSNSAMPNRKTDTNNNRGFSTDFIGQNYEYPEASYQRRAEIRAQHLRYQQGLMWTLANHPRVPAEIRNEVSRWGMCKDEFRDGNGWQEQIYVREARRMVGNFVMTQNHCQQREKVEDSVGMGAYTMDSHNVQRYVDSRGMVRNEGDVQVGGFPPYPISYQSLVPKKSECKNLLVPVCLSASHMAFGSIRMEPVFMVLGQSSGTAAAMSIDQECDVQDIDYRLLRSRLLADGQVLQHVGTQRSAHYRKLDSLSGIIADDTQAELEGAWAIGTLEQGVHLGYRHDGAAGDSMARATFRLTIPTPGIYDVQVAYSAHPNRASNVPVTVQHQKGADTQRMNQRVKPNVEGLFQSVGKFTFDKTGSVSISNQGTDGYVIVDAIRLIKSK